MDIERLWKEYRYRLLHYLRDHSRWNRRRPPVVAFPELATECPDTGTQTQETRLEVRNEIPPARDPLPVQESLGGKPCLRTKY